MRASTELERVRTNNSCEATPGYQVKLTARSRSPATSIDQIKSVYEIVASVSDWPDDAWWQSNLPEWFLAEFSEASFTVWRAQPRWDFGSWLDASRERGWEWWSSSYSPTEVEILLAATADPYSVEPLIYVSAVSGCTDIQIDEFQ